MTDVLNVGGREVFDYTLRIVDRCVVHDNQLEVRHRLAQNARNGTTQSPASVVGWDDDAYRWHIALSTSDHEFVPGFRRTAGAYRSCGIRLRTLGENPERNHELMY